MRKIGKECSMHKQSQLWSNLRASFNGKWLRRRGENAKTAIKYGLIGGAFIALLSAGESLIPVVHADPVNEGTTVFAQNQRQFHVDGGLYY